MSVARNTAYDYGSQVMIMVMALLQSMIIGRWMGPQDYGMFVFVVQANALCSVLFGLSLTVSNIYFCGKNPRRLGQLNAISWVLTLAICSAIYLALRWLGPWVARQVQNPEIPAVPFIYIVIALLFLPVTIYYAAWIGLMVGRGAIRKLSFYNIGYHWIQTVVFIQVVVRFDLGIRGFLAAWGAINLCHLVGMWLVLRTEGAAWGRFGLRDLRQVLSFSVRAHWGNFAISLIQKMDWLFVNRAQGPEGLGIYSRAGQLFNYTTTGIDALERAGYSTITAAERAEAGRLIQRMVRNAVLLSFIGMAILFPLARSIVVLLWGPEFEPAADALRVLILGLPFFCSNRMFAMYFTGQLGKPHVSSFLTWLVVPVAFGLLWALVPRYGMTGAAAAMVGTYSMLCVLFLSLFVRSTGLRNPVDYLMPKSEDFNSYIRYARQFFTRGKAEQ